MTKTHELTFQAEIIVLPGSTIKILWRLRKNEREASDEIYLLLLTLALSLVAGIITFYIVAGTWARIDRGLDQIDNMIACMKGCPP